MTACRIRLSGCDESTQFDMDLDDDEAALLERVAARSREVSEYDCMPTMTVTPHQGASS